MKYLESDQKKKEKKKKKLQIFSDLEEQIKTILLFKDILKIRFDML